MKHKEIKKLTPSEKNYLRAIYNLSCMSDCHYARPINVALYNKVSRPSVTIALKRLQQYELIGRLPSDGIFLTEKGLQTAESMMRRFLIIELFLENILNVGKEMAEKDAWDIEHVISNQTIEKMRKYLNEN